MTLARRYVQAIFVMVVWGLLASGAAAQEVTLRGFVTDASDGQPLPGANIVLQRAGQVVQGAATDVDGFYRVAEVEPGRYVVRISHIGYLPRTDTLRLEEAFVSLNAALQPAEQQLGEVTVAAEDEAGAATLEAGLQEVRPEDLDRVPTPGAGGDLAMYLQTLPGVVAAGDRGGQLFIRGGTPSQNMILLDGTLVYQPFHIIGFFSAFPEDLVSGVDFYAGGFPARYTGRISSVIDVTTRAGNNRRFEGGASFGPFLVEGRFEGPLNEGSMSILASVRTSVIEQTAPAFLGQELPLTFGDQFVKLQSTSENGRCSVTGLHTYDRGRLDFESDDTFRWSNYVLSGRCLAFAASSPLTSDMSAGFSYFENAVGSASDGVTTANDERTAGIWRFQTDGSLQYQVGRAALEWGFHVRASNLKYNLRERFQGVGTSEAEFLIAANTYVGTRWTPGDRFVLHPSVAFTMFTGLRPSIEPRLRASWRPWGSEAHQLNAAAGLYRQTLVGLSDERDAGSVFTAWMFAPYNAERPEAVHALLGWKSALGAGVGVSLEGYYKWMTNLLTPVWDSNARFTTTLGPASGASYGFDVRADLRRGPFYLHLGYGYSHTRYGLEQENESAWFDTPVQNFHPAHDRRHQLSVLSSVELGAWQASIRWQYGSGLPYTAPQGFDTWLDLRRLPDVQQDIGQPRFLFEQPFNKRLPAYHRLDVAVERDFSLSVADVTLEAGAVNLYDRSNLFYFDLFSLRRVDQLPLVPYLSMSLSTR